MTNIHKNVPLAPLTTFRIGGVAEYFVEVTTENELREAITWSKENSLKFIILAGGSNVLIPDEGIKGLLIHITMDGYDFEGPERAASAGCNLLHAIEAATDTGIGGWEKLAGIPGTVGGAVRGNAGAFGSEIKDFVTSVRALDSESGEVKNFVNAECNFSYRHSYFKDHPEWIITDVELKGLITVAVEESKRLATETILEREKRHLQDVKAAGSFFMNPVAPADIVEMFEKEKGVKSRESRVPAGWLIEKAGMKGATVGGAIASPQHPNYIVNKGGASSNDVKALAQKIKIAVMSQYGVRLQEEAAIL